MHARDNISGAYNICHLGGGVIFVCVCARWGELKFSYGALGGVKVVCSSPIKFLFMGVLYNSFHTRMVLFLVRGGWGV